MSKKVQRKICVLGDWASGKTSLVRRYVHNIYDDHYVATIGVKISSKVMVDTELLLNIIDQMRVSIPEEIQEAKRLLRDREKELAAAAREAPPPVDFPCAVQ